MSDASKKTPFSVFLAASVVIFFLTLSAADSVGFVPYYIDGTDPHASIALKNLPELGDEAEGVAHNPDRLVISAIDLDLPVQNPATTDLEALDVLLQKGPARYADSAQLGEKGNVVIFAHSSHLPIVHNQMFKAFNRVPELSAGDSITLKAGETSYIYQVISVVKEDASDGKIDLSKTGHTLTLVTCDTLTGKSARFVLTAELVGTI